jgi:hypothetical protein
LKMELSKSSQNIDPATREALADLGKKWAIDHARPRVSAEMESAWTKLINDWAEEVALPLVVRKARNNRGSLISGAEGRGLVPTDNSPAQWAFVMAESGRCPNLDQIDSLLRSYDVPVAMVFRKDEYERAVYKGRLRNCQSTAAKGWRLGHIEGIGLKRRGEIKDFPLSEIKLHFVRFMSPDNMFLVPAEWGGLAEAKSFVNGYRSALVVA